MAYRPKYKNASGTVIDLPLDAETVQGVDVVAMLAGSSDVQIASGSYVGTGTYGASNKNSLTLDFVPKLLIIQYVLYSSSAKNLKNESLIWLAGSEYFTKIENLYTATSFSLADLITVEVSGSTISWYNTSNALRQFNNSGQTYYYFAIGAVSQLATPTIALNSDGITLEITDVKNATSYDVYIDGTLKTNVAKAV